MRVLGDDEVGAVVVAQKLPLVPVLAHERLAESCAVDARGLATRVGPLQVGVKCDVVLECVLKRSDDIGDCSVDAAACCFGEVAVDLRAGGGVNISKCHRLYRMSKKKSRPVATPAPFIPGLVDAHTHLASCGARSAAEIEAIVQRAVDAGVEAICTVGDGLEEAEEALKAAHLHERVYAACAIHPTRAAELDAAARARLTQMAADPRCVAVGETGIDTYWIQHDPQRTAPLEVQEEALRWHIDLAVQSAKALMIHNREGDEELLRILADAPAPPQVILHCFSSPLDVAREALDRGYVLSFAGNVTFKRNDALRQAAALAPDGQYLIETDAPYMTPEPFRGARNESAFIGHTAQVVAQARGITVEALAQQVQSTFERVYGVRV